MKKEIKFFVLGMIAAFIAIWSYSELFNKVEYIHLSDENLGHITVDSISFTDNSGTVTGCVDFE